MPSPRASILLIALSLSLVACNAKRRAAAADDSVVQSLTLDNSGGKKAYFGWGEVLDGFMGNETKYDVKHTNDIFTSGAGGAYTAKTLIDRPFDGDDVMQTLRQVVGNLGPEDMYVQYSAGHGFNGGLAVGVEYRDVVSTVLGSQAKEVVIFTMACYSGSIVDEMNRQRGKWENWGETGRTLFVMASSRTEETSSTGPGTDRSQRGPNGSAGSAYGHALWKALSGEADGYLDGVKDGFVALGEIAAYTTDRTKEIGDHTPVVTGVYHPQLIMNKNPNGAYTAAQLRDGGTGNLSDQDVKRATRTSDESMSTAPQSGS